MGIASSPLRDRVIFIEGVPRSGTTWFVTLLSLHPQVAAIPHETHLFDLGVDRLFHNFEMQDSRFLRGYVSRSDLTDLVRDLCDGVLLRMRESTKPGASFVAEKTPVPASSDAHSILSRKLECFPDAWFIHLVRDGRAVARSLVRTPWMRGRSEDAAYDLWLRCSQGIRSGLASSSRYREVPYERVQPDPVTAISELLEWIGLEGSPGYFDAVQEASRVSYAPWSVRGDDESEPRASPLRTLTSRLRHRISRWRVREASEPGPSDAASVRRFVDALRDGDDDSLHASTTSELSVVAYLGTDRLSASADEARRLLLDVGRRVFQPRLIREKWTLATGTWLSEHKMPSVTALISGSRGDGRPVDLFLALGLEGRRVSSAVAIVVGEAQ